MGIFEVFFNILCPKKVINCAPCLVEGLCEVVSKSLIIHRIKRMKSLPWRRFENVILITIKFGELLL